LKIDDFPPLANILRFLKVQINGVWKLQTTLFKKIKQRGNKWDIICQSICPQQTNGSDCGVYACLFAEMLARNIPIDNNVNITDYDIKIYRLKMASILYNSD
jgi:Ulp1 family protease